MQFTVPLDLSVLLTTVGMFPGEEPIIGKVCDVYIIDDETMLILRTDRISALDKRLRQGVPNKGRTLNLLSEDYFQRTADIVPNHLISCDVSALPERWQEMIRSHLTQLEGRFMLVRRGKNLGFEAVVRGFISGTFWKAYVAAGGPEHDVVVWGIALPGGMHENQELPKPEFTPTLKATSGHDDPVTFEELIAGIGKENAIAMRDASLKLYITSRARMIQFGILKADEKYEFALDANGILMLIDEANTPDSSRFWEASTYWLRLLCGQAPKSMDKDDVRRWLREFREEEIPDMPAELVAEVSRIYVTLLKMVTGIDLEASASGRLI